MLAIEETTVNSRKDTDAPAQPGVADLLWRVKGAFDLFGDQSASLQSAFDGLKRDLARVNAELKAKNEALSSKLVELEQMSRRMHCILESLTDGVLVVNEEYRVERINPVAANLLDLACPRIEGQPYAEIANGLGNADALRAAIEQGRTLLDQQRSHVTADGRRVVVLASVAPIGGASGRAIGAVEVLRDVTELRTLEDRVQHQKRMVALGEMAASVAHEIRNPLGSIEGFARLLKHDLDEADLPEYTRLAAKIVEGAKNLNYVVSSLLTYARPVTLECEWFDGAELLRCLRDVLAPCAGERNVRVVVRAPRAQRRPYGDRRLLLQALVNLGRNAIEASASGGEVIVAAVVSETAATWTVTDRGHGIAAGDVGRLFDPFFTCKENGTGLGLALCHKTVSAHGGEIRVESEPGRGAVFTVSLPLPGGRRHDRRP